MREKEEKCHLYIYIKEQEEKGRWWKLEQVGSQEEVANVDINYSYQKNLREISKERLWK